MSNLVSIEGRTRRGEVRRHVVDTLKKWLAEAERGEIIALAIAGVCPDGTSNTEISDSDEFHRLLAALTILQFRMLDESRQVED